MDNFSINFHTFDEDSKVKLYPLIRGAVLETSQSKPGSSKNIDIELTNEDLEQLRAWLDCYFKTKNEKIQKQQDRNRKLFEDDLFHIETDEHSVSSSVTVFIADIADYLDFTYSPRAVATLRNSVQVCWKNDDVILIMEFLYVPQSTPLVVWEVRDKEGQYSGEGRIATHSDYIEQINKLVEVFYHPLTAEA